MPRPPVPTLYELADALLGAVVDGFATLGRPLPDLRIVAPGQATGVAYDCALLAVTVENTFAHDGNIASQVIQPVTGMPSWALRGVSLAVQILRCVSTVKQQGTRVLLPSAAEIDVDAQLVLGDGQALTNVFLDAAKAGAFAGRNSTAIESWQSLGPGGGLAGGLLRVRIGLA